MDRLRHDPRIQRIGESGPRHKDEEEKFAVLQGCANISKSIATSLEKAGRPDEATRYWLKAASFEQKILKFVEENRLEDLT